MRLSMNKLYIVFIAVACFTACLFGVIDSRAEDISSDYKVTIFNQENGLGSSEVNCIYQTQSGYIWIGTDGGLYRYNGNEFRLFNLWNTDKADVYYINSLFQDSEGSLWIATNNYGLFRMSGNDIYHFSDEYYSGVKCVNKVCEAADGTIYIATAYGVYTVNQNSDSLVRNEELAKHNIKDITSNENGVYGIYNGNIIFCIHPDGTISEMSSLDYSTDELSAISCDDSGNVYVGTISNDVLRINSYDHFKVIQSAMEGVNSIYSHGDRMYICTDNGVGYFDSSNNFIILDGDNIDNYISDMLIDYEGNYWFSSSKSGLYYISRSKFSNINKKYSIPDYGTNCAKCYDGFTYIGTDDGLFVLDQGRDLVSNELTDYLTGVSIRDIIQDDEGNIWFGTYRKYGVVKYSPDGNITTYNKSTGLISNLVNCLYERRDGGIIIGTEDGISIINRSGRVTDDYNYESGLEYSNIISIYQDDAGVIYAGSDGGGLYIIDNGNISSYTDVDGLNSNVISSITAGSNGLWIGTNNGLAYYDGTFRTISNVDFSNNIYDIIINDSILYIVGSKGLIYASEDDLLSTSYIAERYYSTGDGLDGAVTINCKCCIYDSDIYIPTTSGLDTFSIDNIQINDVSPKLTISEINIDGDIYYYDQLGGEINVPSDTQRVEVSFAVLSYTNRENIQVEYQLVGFDKEPVVVDSNDSFEAIYTNLDGGRYVFEASAVNGDGVQSDRAISFVINKEEGMLEKRWVRVAIIISVILIFLIAFVIIIRIWRQFNSKKRELQDLAKRHEDVLKSSTAKTDYLANMSNEIKLPINAMIRSAGNMLRDGTENEENQEKLREIVDKGHDVIGKVDETILMARLESGAEEVSHEPYSVTTLICDISDSMLNKLDGQPIKFLVDLGDNIPDILIGDFDKIKTVLDIILDNSIKYTKEGSIILSVDSYITGDDSRFSILFSVSDTGTGITEDRLDHIFEIYVTEESKKTSSEEGTGISLFIAKKLSEIMGGELEVESTYGAGTTFTFTVEQGRPDMSGNKIPVNDNTIERVSREEAERMWAPDLHVLLVDDVDLSRNVAADVIKSMEIKCDTATGGVSAIDMVMTNHYDMVFMDIAMPVMNGIDALREIRDLCDEYYTNLPIIAMSEDVIGKNKQEMIDEGFSDVILKPFDITILASLLNRFVDNDKIKYRTSDVTQYITESRYSEGLRSLEDLLDVVSVVERIGGSIEVYNRILITFYNQNRDSIDELSQKLRNDYRGFRNKIHNIRTGCQNIGAAEAAEITLRIENAINIGNRTYVENNISLVYDCISVINEAIEEYMTFVSEQKGVSDEEYSERIKKNDTSDADTGNAYESEIAEESDVKSDTDETDIIDIELLKSMKSAAYREDLGEIQSILSKISEKQYGNEDSDFINALRDTIDRGDMIEIDDLLNTYIDLKSDM